MHRATFPEKSLNWEYGILSLVVLKYIAESQRGQLAKDTWFPSWASDGHLYTPWTDGYVSQIHSQSSCKGLAALESCVPGGGGLKSPNLSYRVWIVHSNLFAVREGQKLNL